MRPLDPLVKRNSPMTAAMNARRAKNPKKLLMSQWGRDGMKE
jgi:hypothetical protein